MFRLLYIFAAISFGQGQTHNRQIANGWFRGRELTFEIVDGKAIFQNDIVLGSASEIAPSKERMKQSLVQTDDSFRWPIGVIPYIIDPNLPNPSRVTDAMALWNQKTLIKFVPRTTESDFVSIVAASSGCNSNVGRSGGVQFVNLELNCPKEAVLHELGHTIGFWHESQRADRDNWLKLNFFEMAKTDWIGGHSAPGTASDSGPFDYRSVMLYGAVFDSWRGRTTIEGTPRGIPIWYPYFGFELSSGIIETVRDWYQPSSDTVLTTHPPGLDLIADGQRIATPARMSWLVGSTHRVEAVEPQFSGLTRHVFATWSDSGERGHDYRVPNGGGVLVANYQRQYLITKNLPAVNVGTFRIDPPSADGYYSEGSTLTFTALPGPGYQFESWYGDVQDFSAGLQGNGANPAVVQLRQPNPSVGAGFRFLGEIVTTITTNPPGLTISVDSVNQVAPFRPNNWIFGSQHVISASTQYSASNVVRWVFTGWSDSGGASLRGISHNIANATYTANFKPQYQLTVLNTSGGSISANPASADGYYDEGTRVEMYATASAGLSISHWIYDLQGNVNPQTLIMDDQKMVGAMFSSVPLQPPIRLTSPLTVYLTAIEGDRGPVYNYPLFSGEVNTDFTIRSDDSAVALSIAQGRTPAMIGITSNATARLPGVYNSTIQIQLPDTSQRTARVVFTVAPRNPVTQPFSNCRFSVAPTSVLFPANGGAGQIQITASDSSCTRSAAANATWITLADGTSTIGSGLINYFVQPNFDPAPRSGFVTIAGQFFQISQTPGAGTLGPPAGLRFVPLSPCRLVDTRAVYSTGTGPFGPPLIPAGTIRTIPIPASTQCSIPLSAKAYVLNLTLDTIENRSGPVDFVTLWPTGEPRPDFYTARTSTGGYIANAAIVKAGLGGAINAYVSNNVNIILDISGYFTDDPAAHGLLYYPIHPCRAIDTRGPIYSLLPPPFGNLRMQARESRKFSIPSSPACQIPSAQAYSMQLTLAPGEFTNGDSVAYVTAYPSGVAQPPIISNMNAYFGYAVANSAIVPADSRGSINVFALNSTNLIADVNGYFGPDDGSGKGLLYFPAPQCRVFNTQDPGMAPAYGGPALSPLADRTIPIATSFRCRGLPSTAKAWALNASVVPGGFEMPFLSMWPAGTPWPNVSQLNAFQGQTVANSAIVPASADGSILLRTAGSTQVTVEVAGYFSR